MGADELGDDAAAVDVAEEDDGDVCGGGEAHVGDVARAEVDLGGAACAFDDDEVAACAKRWKLSRTRGRRVALSLP